MGGSRPVRAGAVFVIAVLLFGGVAGLGQADDGPDMPATFGIAMPQQGDEARYGMTTAGAFQYDDVRAEDDTAGPSYHWADDTVIRDGDGDLRAVDKLEAVRWSYFPFGFPSFDFSNGEPEEKTRYWSRDESHTFYEAGSHRPLAVGAGGEITGVPGSELPGGVRVGSDIRAATHYWNYQTGPDDCLVQSPLQGASSITDRDMEAPPCAVAGMQVVFFEPRLKAIGVEDVDGVQAMHYVMTDMASLPDIYADKRLDLWYAPDLPVPLAAHASWDDLIVEGRVEVRLALEAWTRGGSPLLTDEDIDPDPAPAIVMAPFDDGLDETGIDHPFPLSAALQAAREDPEVAAHLGAHPDAYVAYASYDEWRAISGVERSWDIGWTGGEGFGVEVVQTSVVNGQGLAPDQVPLVEVEPGFAGAMFAAHAPATPPAEAPSVASLWARWAAYRGDGTEPNQWSFWVMAGQPEADPDVHVQGGVRKVSQHDLDLADPAGSGFRVEMSALVVNGTGVTESFFDNQLASSTVPAVEGPPPSATGGVDAGAAAGGFWSPPSPEQAAGVGFLALLAAALYYFWPSLKALPLLGGFSRLKKDELEEHPARAAIMDVVRAEPGLHFREIRRRTGLANGTARHHLAQLEAKELLSTRKAGGYTCYFARGEIGREAMAAASAARSDGARRVLDAVRDWPGATNKDIAGVTGLSPSTVSHHLKRLGEVGVVTRTELGLQAA